MTEVKLWKYGHQICNLLLAFLQPFVEYFPLFSRNMNDSSVPPLSGCASSWTCLKAVLWELVKIFKARVASYPAWAFTGSWGASTLESSETWPSSLLLLHPAPLLLPHPGSNFPKARVTGPRVTSLLEIPELETCSLKQLQPSPLLL